MKNQHILVTGGAGFIGSHTVVELLQAGHAVTVLDNFCNSRPSVLERIARIAGRAPQLIEADIRSRIALRRVFATNAIDAVIHCAGLKAVGESAADPLRYYENNVAGSLALFDVMCEAGVNTLVFSSSATVYGDPQVLPYHEGLPLAPVNPYGRSKAMIEDVLRDLQRAEPHWKVALLRYFNPVGAHPSGLIGEDPHGQPNNLMPFIAQVAAGGQPALKVFGADYPTPDGTGIRDYLHVVDLARGHLAALDVIGGGTGGLLSVNLGTGRGYSVLDMVRAFARASGREIPTVVAPRRAGDLAAYYADPALAREVLGWQAQFDLDAMCADTWRWQQWAAANLAG